MNLSIDLRTSGRDLENASVEKIHIPILIEYYVYEYIGAIYIFMMFSPRTGRNVIFFCVRLYEAFRRNRSVFFKFSLKTAREIGTTLLVSCGKLIHVVERRTHRQDGGAYTGKVTRVGFAFEISF